jgi:hypothetical protein
MFQSIDHKPDHSKRRNIMDLIKGKSIPLITLATTSLILLPVTAQAVDFEVSGQINRLIMNVDNGEENGVVHADNSNSGTRVRVKGQGETDNGIMVGMYYEYQLQSNPSDKITEDSLDSDGVGGNTGSGDNFSNRNANVWFKGNFGKVTVGQGSGATDGSAEIDLSGTTVIQYASSNGDMLGDMEYGTSGVTVGDARSDFDGLGRNDNLRYDAGFDNFSVAGSTGNGSKVELSGKYKTDNLEIMIGIWDEGDSGGENQGHAISASWLAENGINLTASYAGINDTDDPSNVYFKVGFKHGNSAYGIDVSETSDLAAGDGSSVSIAWVNNIMKGVQIYASYREESLDDVSGEDDITALAGGARVKF